MADSEEVTLRDHLEAQIMALKEQLANSENVRLRELQLAREVTDQTRKQMDEKLQEMNQFRHQLEAERERYVTRDMLDARLGSVTGRMQELEKRADIGVTRDTLDARMQGEDARLLALSARLDLLERMKANLEGRLWAIGAALGVLIVVVNWLLHFAPAR